MTDERAHRVPAGQDARTERRWPLDYQRQPAFGAPERFGWKDVAVIVFILLGPIVLWTLMRAVGIR